MAGRGRGSSTEQLPHVNELTVIAEFTKAVTPEALAAKGSIAKATEYATKLQNVKEEALDGTLTALLADKLGTIPSGQPPTFEFTMCDPQRVSTLSKIRFILAFGGEEILNILLNQEHQSAITATQHQHNVSIAEITEIAQGGQETAKATYKLAEIQEEEQRLKYEPWASQLKRREMTIKSLRKEMIKEEAIRGMAKGLREAFQLNRHTNFIHLLPEAAFLLELMQQDVPEGLKLQAYERLMNMKMNPNVENLRKSYNLQKLSAMPTHERTHIDEETKAYVAVGLLSETGTVTQFAPLTIESTTTRKGGALEGAKNQQNLSGGGTEVRFWQNPHQVRGGYRQLRGRGRMPIVATETGHALVTDDLENALTNMNRQILQIQTQLQGTNQQQLPAQQQRGRGRGVDSTQSYYRGYQGIRRNYERGRGGRSIECYACGEPGHIAAHCPNQIPTNNNPLTGTGDIEETLDNQDDTTFCSKNTNQQIEKTIEEAVLFKTIFRQCVSRPWIFLVSPRALPRFYDDLRKDAKMSITDTSVLLQTLITKRQNNTGIKIKLLLWPLFVGEETNGHWALASFDTETKECTHYDSLMKLKQSEAAFTVARRIVASVIGTTFIKTKIVHEQQNQDEKNCGHLVVRWVLRIIRATEHNQPNLTGGGPSPHKCSICNEVFATKQVAQRHGVSKHAKSEAEMENFITRVTIAKPTGRPKSTPIEVKSSTSQAFTPPSTQQKFGPYNITQESLQEMQRAQSFTHAEMIDDIIDLFSKVIKAKDVAIFPTYAIELLARQRQGIGEWEDHIGNAKKMLIMVMHVENIHWTVLKIENNTATIIDSIRAMRHPKHYEKILSEINRRRGTTTKWQVQTINATTQPNQSQQCGQFVVVNVIRIAKGLQPLIGDEISLHPARKLMAEAIITRNVSKLIRYAEEIKVTNRDTKTTHKQNPSSPTIVAKQISPEESKSKRESKSKDQEVKSIAKPRQGFQEVRGRDHPDQLKIAALRDLELIPMTEELYNERPDLQWISLATWKQAYKAMQLVINHAKQHNIQKPLPIELIRFSQTLRTKNQWDPATQRNFLSSLATVLSRLPQLTFPPKQGINMSKSKAWTDTWNLLKKQHTNLEMLKERPVANRNEIIQALATLEQIDTKDMLRSEIRDFLQWTWLADGRPSGVARLRKANVTQMSDQTLAITWTDDKRANRAGPYTTRPWIPSRWKHDVDIRIKSTNKTELLFPTINKQYKRVTNWMREKLGISFRAMRRGPPHVLAQAGVTPEQIQQLTGHKTPSQVMTYLNWGKPIKMSREMLDTVQQSL